MRIAIVVFLCVGVCWTQLFAEDAVDSEEPLWKSRYDWNLAGVAVTRGEDHTGQDMDGIRLTWGGCSCRGSEMGDIGGELFLAIENGTGIDAYEAGVLLQWPYLWFRYVDVSPRLTLGFEYRDNDPDKGFGGLAGLGLEVGTWITNRVELAAFVDREFGLSSGTRNQVGVALRVGALRPKGDI